MEQAFVGRETMGTKNMTGGLLKAAARKRQLGNTPAVMRGRRFAIEVAGWLHRACKRNPKEVCLHGISQEAVLYITTRIEAVRGEGATPVIVFDGDRSFEPKLAELASRRKSADGLSCRIRVMS